MGLTSFTYRRMPPHMMTKDTSRLKREIMTAKLPEPSGKSLSEEICAMKRTILFVASLGFLFVTTPVLATYAYTTASTISTPPGPIMPPVEPNTTLSSNDVSPMGPILPPVEP